MEKIRIRDEHPGSATLYKDNDNCRLAADPRAYGEGERGLPPLLARGLSPLHAPTERAARLQGVQEWDASS